MKTLVAAAAAIALVASFAPQARADEDALPGYSPPHVVDYTGGRVPAYAHLEQRTNTTLIERGLAVTGATYAISVLYALGTCGAQMECRSGSQWLYVPVLGPFMTAAQAPTTGGEALSVFDGALQAAGVGFAIAGILMPRPVVVWQDPQSAVSVTPAVLQGGAGVSMTVTTL